MGLIAFFDPKFHLFRDIGMAESKEPGTVERIVARLVSLIVIGWGSLFLYWEFKYHQFHFF